MTVPEPIFILNAMLGRQLVATNSYTRFHENPTNIYSLMLGARQTNGRMWSLQRTTQTDLYNNDASCLLCGKK